MSSPPAARRRDRGAPYVKVAFLPDLELIRRRLAIIEQVDAGLARYAEVVQLIAAADDRAAGRLAIIALLNCDEMAARAITDATFEQLTKQRRGEMTAGSNASEQTSDDRNAAGGRRRDVRGRLFTRDRLRTGQPVAQVYTLIAAGTGVFAAVLSYLLGSPATEALITGLLWALVMVVSRSAISSGIAPVGRPLTRRRRSRPNVAM